MILFQLFLLFERLSDICSQEVSQNIRSFFDVCLWVWQSFTADTSGDKVSCIDRRHDRLMEIQMKGRKRDERLIRLTFKQADDGRGDSKISWTAIYSLEDVMSQWGRLLRNTPSTNCPRYRMSFSVTCYSLSVHHKTNSARANEGEISCKRRNSKK